MKVYLIQQENTAYYKIGFTRRNTDKRKKELQTGNGNMLKILYEFETKYGYKLETSLHAHFKLKKVNSEWFELTGEDVANFIPTCLLYENIYEQLRDNPFVF